MSVVRDDGQIAPIQLDREVLDEGSLVFTRGEGILHDVDLEKLVA